MLITATDLSQYSAGYAAGLAHQDMPETNDWWWREGWNDAIAKWKPVPLVVGSVPPDFQPWTPLNTQEWLDYLAGFAGDKSTQEVDEWWYRVGLWDRANGKPQRAVAESHPPPPFHETNPVSPQPVFNQQPGSPPPDRNNPATIPGNTTVQPLTTSPCFELVCTIFGKLTAYDRAVNLVDVGNGQGLLPLLVGFAVHFDLVGDGPGDERLGYHLSGPAGPIAEFVSRNIAAGKIASDPSAYNLSAWIGTHLSSGAIRLLGITELQHIGMDAAAENLGQTGLI